MAWLYGVPSIKDTAKDAWEDMEENMSFLEENMKQQTSFYDVGLAQMRGASFFKAAATDPTQASHYLYPHTLQYSATPGVSGFRTGDIFWHTNEKRLYILDTNIWYQTQPIFTTPQVTVINSITQWGGNAGGSLRDTTSASIDSTGYNLYTHNILNFATINLWQKIISRLDITKLRAIWFFNKYDTETTTNDVNPLSTHTNRFITFRDQFLNTVQANKCSPSIYGSIRRMKFSSNRIISANDCADFTFGDGVSDKEMSCIVCLLPTSPATSSQTILGKWGVFPSFSSEWGFSLSANNLYVYFYDLATSYFMYREALGGVCAGDNAEPPKVYGFTYDGSSLHTGIKIYRNGVQVDTGGYKSPSYTAMGSKPSALGNFYRQAIYEVSNIGLGDYCFAMLIEDELEASVVRNITNLLLCYFNGTLL